MNYYHIGFSFAKPLSDDKQSAIRKQISSVSSDWCYYANNCYLVFSGHTADRIHIMVREALDKEDLFLIVPLDMRSERQGLLPEWMWAWMDLDRSQPNWWEARTKKVIALMPPPEAPKPEVPSDAIGEILKRLSAPKEE